MGRQTQNIKPHAYVYIRRSQDREDRQQLTIEKQDAAIRDLVGQHDLDAIYLPPEERSAKRPGRPIFNEMIEGVKSGKARYIAVWHLSRLSRNAFDAGQIIQLMDDGHLLKIITPARSYRNTPDDKAFLNIELTFHKKNNDDLGKQVSESIQQKLAKGQYPGPAPIGYVNAIIGPKERNLSPDPDKKEKIIEMVNKAASGGYTLDDMWRHADEINLTSKRGNQLSKQSVAELLQRRLYTGTFHYAGSWHKGSFEPLISLEKFEEVQIQMGWAKKSPRKPHSTSGRSYPFKGPLLCAGCGHNITAYTKIKKLASGKLEEYIFYVCTRKSKKVKCREPQISSESLHEEVRSRVGEFSITEDEGAECIKWLQLLYGDYTRKKNQYRQVWVKDRRGAQKAMDVLDSKLEAGTISDDRYKARIAKHESIVVRTTQLLKDKDQDARRWLELSIETFSKLVDVGEIFDEANDEEKRRIMNFLGLNWNLGNKKVVLTPREPLSMLCQSTQNPNWRARPDLNRRSPP